MSLKLARRFFSLDSRFKVASETVVSRRNAVKCFQMLKRYYSDFLIREIGGRIRACHKKVDSQTES